jgi:poly(A) polymerase
LRIRYSTEKNGKLVKKAIVYTRDEHGINYSDVDNEAVYIIERLRANGCEAYVVGGAVRDLILGKKPKDFDIVTGANPGKIKKVFRNARIIGHRFRLVHVYFGPKIFEVSTFRSLKDGPTSNTFGTIEEDVLRRDFTLNALFYDPLRQIVVDYVGGMKDIRDRRIRPIIPMSHIFTDDPVRMIRAVKYGAATGCRIPFLLGRRIKKQGALLASVSPSRLTEEIFKIIHSPAAGKIVASLDARGLYRYLQPEAAKLFGEKQGFRERYLKTMGALDQEHCRPGEIFSALVRDYLEDYADWGEEKGEHGGQSSFEKYRETLIAARQFVLPMNPPRLELEWAVRLIFGEHGITVKKGRPGGRAGSREGEAGEAAALPGRVEEPGGEERKRPRRRRRRRPAE